MVLFVELSKAVGTGAAGAAPAAPLRSPTFWCLYMCALLRTPLTWTIAFLVDLVIYSVVERGLTSTHEMLKHNIM